MPLHLGLHAGDVIREDNNVYGGAVNIASRISGLSAPGEVLVSDTVRGLARTSAGGQAQDPGATAAATYAGRHRERVSHLVAINPVTAVRDLWEKSPVFRAMRAMEDVAEEEWEAFTLMIANSVNDFRGPGTARELADAYRSGMKPADLIAYLRTSLETDPADLFGSIAAPALVVFERTTARERSREVAQRLAQRIPRARFVETDDAARAI